MADWIEIPEYLPDIPECNTPDCFTMDGSLTEEEFYSLFTEHTFLIGIYTNATNGGISASFPWNDGVPPSFGDLLEKWLIAYPTASPKYGWNGVREDGTYLSEDPTVNYDPCGEMTPGFRFEIMYNSGNPYWRAYAEAHTTRYLYVTCPNFECPPEYQNINGECIPYIDPDKCYECWYLIPGDIDCDGGLLEFTIGYYNNGASVCGNFVVSGRPLQISYAGSTVPLSGPTEIMGSTFNQTKFYVSVPSTICSTDEIHVELINPGGVNLGILPDCDSSVIVTNNCPCPVNGGGGGGGGNGGNGPEIPDEGGGNEGGSGDPTPTPGIPEDTDCCTFFNDNYTEWEYTNCIDFFASYPAKY